MNAATERKLVVTGWHKIDVEMKAEQLADNGYQMIGAPYYSHELERWEHEVKKQDQPAEGGEKT